MYVGVLWARGADIALRFPGGGEALAAALAQRGQILQNAGGIWILR